MEVNIDKFQSYVAPVPLNLYGQNLHNQWHTEFTIFPLINLVNLPATPQAHNPEDSYFLIMVNELQCPPPLCLQ